MNTLSTKYQKQTRPELVKKYKLNSPFAAPSIHKITINMGTGAESADKGAIEDLKNQLAIITGQLPTIRPAKSSIAGFGLRQGAPVGITVTLRGEKMYSFLQKLINAVLPRIRDFRGVKKTSFDKSGNYTLGISEFTVFPEIDLAKAHKIKGLEITITIKNSDVHKSLDLLTALGMPFEKNDTKK